jgi:hypothetical protein
MLRAMAGFAVLVALLFFAIPAQADEIEPEPAPQAEPEAEPEPVPEPEPEPVPEPAPEPVPDVVSEEEEEFSEPAWIPSLDVGLDGYSYDVETTIVNLTNPSSRSGTQSESVNQVVFRFGGELMGPMFENIPGRPRLFVQGGVGINAYSSDRVFAIDDPDDPNSPEQDIRRYEVGGARGKDLPSDFKGQGSWLDAGFQDPSWYAGLGIAFSVQTSGGMVFHFKPSFQYSAEQIDFMGRLGLVTETTPPGTPQDLDPCGTNPQADPPWPLCNRTFDVLESNANSSTTDHSIGPGFEIAMAFRPFGPIRISLFGQARVQWLVSDAVTRFGDALASYSVEREDYVWRGGAGIRLSWVGFD